MPEPSEEVLEAIRDLDRGACEALLTSYGFSVYDHESVEELREAIQANVDGGTIEGGEVLVYSFEYDLLNEPQGGLE